MKTNKIYALASFVFVMLVTIFIACQKNQSAPDATDNLTVFVPDTKHSFNLSEKKQLNSFVKVTSRETAEMQILSTEIKDFTDSRGPYRGVLAKYKIGNDITTMIVPLTENQIKSAKGPTASYVAECEMKCTSAWVCSSCEQTIIERCKKQTCACTSGSGGCSSKITFSSEP